MPNRTRRQKKQRRQKHQTSRSLGRARPGDAGTFRLYSFEITDEPMPEAAERALSPELLDRLDALTERVHEGSLGDQLDEIQAMLKLCPEIPRLHNYLGTAYERLGRWDDARQVIKDTYERFPHYVFGISNYVTLCIEDGDLEEAGRALNKRYSICEFARGRRKFHPSEVVSYQSAVGLYLCAIGQPEHALSHAEMLVELAPDHPLVWRLLVKLYMHGQALDGAEGSKLTHMFTKTAAASMASASA